MRCHTLVPLGVTYLIPLFVPLQSRGACPEQALQDNGRMLPKCYGVKGGLPSTRASRMRRIFGLYECIYCYRPTVWVGILGGRMSFASHVSKAQWNIFRAACSALSLQTKCTSSSCICANTLQPLPDLLVCLKKFGNASVNADALALAEFAFCVPRVDTFCVACPEMRT